jgi:hypothetical protein
MDAYDRCTNLGEKNFAHSVAICGRGQDLFRPPTYRWKVLCYVETDGLLSTELLQECGISHCMQYCVFIVYCIYTPLHDYTLFLIANPTKLVSFSLHFSAH